MNWLKRRIPLILITLFLVLGARFGMDISDAIRLANYTPTAEIATLAERTQMTEFGRRLFYVNSPQIESQKNYLNVCKSSETTLVLGCYIRNKGIYLQRIDDKRLDGVMEVTAAHEMLHVAYDRLSITEQNKLNSQLLAAFANIKNDRIRQLVESYRRRDPEVVNTELHSILGTEERLLTPALERHYTKYFTKRSTVVSLSEQYENVFTSLRDRARTIETQLKTIKDNITSSQSHLEREAASIKSERQSIESLQQSSPGDYRGRIDSYNTRVDSLNQLTRQINTEIDRYKSLATEYKSLALQEKSLVESLDHPTSNSIDSNSQQ